MEFTASRLVLEYYRGCGAAVGELVALSQATTPHKRFLSVLIRRRTRVALLFELELSLGMRKYMVFIIGDRGVLPSFRRDIGHYVIPKTGSEDVGQPPERKSIHEIPRKEKGKQLLFQESSRDKGQVELGSRLVEQGTKPAPGDLYCATSARPVVVEPSSHSDGDGPMSHEPSGGDITGGAMVE